MEHTDQVAPDSNERDQPSPDEQAPPNQHSDSQQSAEDIHHENPPAEAPDYGTEEIRSSQVVYNIIRSVTAESATFGVSEHESRRATGKIGPDEVRSVLERYVEPAELDEARAILESRRVVVLVGPEGIGKRATALRLLSEACAGSAELPTITSLSPATSLIRLATTVAFRKGRGYLVRDHVGDSVELPVRAHDAELLVNTLDRTGSWLVITTMSAAFGPRHLPGMAVAMRPPDPVRLLDRCLEGLSIDDELRERARQCVGELRCPREIVALARRLASRPDEAFIELESTARTHVVEWADGPMTKQDVLTVTTLALIGSQPEPTFEALLAMVSAHAAPPPNEREAAPYVDPANDFMPQRPRDHKLITVTRDDDLDEPGHSRPGRKVRFRLPEHRAIVLEILHDRFGYQLWDPVRRWLSALSPLQLRPEIRGELAFSLARLARSDFGDVDNSFLQPWANGVASERATAAMVLWFMSEDDKLASLALRTAMDWGQDRGLHRAITSAIALGGPLGLRFPAESMRRLCFLALRAKRIGVVARMSLAFLFATAADESATSAGEVLVMVRRELRRALRGHAARAVRDAGPPAEIESGEELVADPYLEEQLRKETNDRDADGPDDDREQYERRWTYNVVLAARHLVVAVLGAPRVDSDEPVAALVLRSQPANVATLGELWADVLCSYPHKAGAMDALRRTLCALQHDSSARHAVARLGAAIEAHMPDNHVRLRAAEIERVMTNERSANRPPKVLVSALLAALSGSTVSV